MSLRVSSIIKKKHIREIFHLMTSGAKTVDLLFKSLKITWEYMLCYVMLNLIEKRHRCMKRALQCFFLIFPNYYSVGDNSDCLQENRYFIKI